MLAPFPVGSSNGAPALPVSAGAPSGGCPGAAVRVGPEPVQLEDQRHPSGDALERELTVENVVPVLEPGAGRPVRHRGVDLDLEEVGGPEVLVTLVVAGRD